MLKSLVILEMISFNKPYIGDDEIDLRIAVAQKNYNQMSKKTSKPKIYFKIQLYLLIVLVCSRLTYLCLTWNID